MPMTETDQRAMLRATIRRITDNVCADVYVLEGTATPLAPLSIH